MSFLDELEIEQSGRGGSITYKEEDKRAVFGWEFSMGGVTIFVPTLEQWDNEFPWAAGRRAEVLLRVAEGVKWRKAPTATYEIDDDAIEFHF